MQVFLDDVVLNETALELSDPSMYRFYQLIWVLRTYILPAVCVIGFILQLWVIVLCCHPLGPTRKSSLQPYLFCLALSDVLFLSMVILDWVKATDPTLDFYSREGFCQGMTYISSLCVFASGWYTCCILLDRYLYLCTSPAAAKYLSTPLKAKFICVSILIIGVVVYLNISLLYTVYIVNYVTEQIPRCMRIEEYRTVVKYFDKIELSLNLGFPYLFTLVLLVLILVSMCISQSKLCCQNATVKIEAGQIRIRSPNSKPNSREHTNNCRQVPNGRREKHQPCFATLSVTTGAAFIILTLPGYVMRVICTVYSEPEHMRKMTLLILLIDQLLQFVFYCRFAFNGILYLMSESCFRKSTKKILKSLMCRQMKSRKNCDKTNGVNVEESESPTRAVLLMDTNYQKQSSK